MGESGQIPLLAGRFILHSQGTGGHSRRRKFTAPDRKIKTIFTIH
jgi:hypothetical protein